MLWIGSFDVKQGRLQEFQEWAKENEGLFQKHAPNGWTHGGTFAYVLGFGPTTAATIWQCENYADFDTFRNHKDETWQRLNKEFFEFMTESPPQAVLLREISEVKFFEGPKPKG